MGYNHNIAYGGRAYHVQTEDAHAPGLHVATHLFAGGTILASHRLGYGASLSNEQVELLMQGSHKSMLRKLRMGVLDNSLPTNPLRRPRPSTTQTRAGRVAGPRWSPAAWVPFRRGLAVGRVAPAKFNLALGKAMNQQIGFGNMETINRTLGELHSEITGVLGVALVDYESGMCLGTIGSGIDLEIAAAGNMEVVRAKMKVMRDLAIEGGIEDMLITLKDQYHIIRPIGTALFLYLAIDRKLGNLALSRRKLALAGDAIAV